MKTIAFIALLTISACCYKTYDISQEPPTINLHFDYSYKGFSPNDTTFAMDVYFHNGAQSTQIFTLGKALMRPDSTRDYLVYQLDAKKLILRNLSSTYTDSITNLGYLSEKKHIGNKRCGHYANTVFEVHATYKGQTYTSANSSDLDLHITP